MASGNRNQPEAPPFDPRIEAKLGIPIKNIVAVASGKGGVGKSTVSVNLAVSLAQTGAAVGLLDADIYGPNIPIMMGVDEMPPVEAGKLIPAEAHGVRFMSMGFLLPPEQALIWRGPMLHKAIQQLFTDVRWGELDYLDRGPAAGHGGRAAFAGADRAAERRVDRNDAADGVGGGCAAGGGGVRAAGGADPGRD